MQHKITCGYMPQEENCHRNGKCDGCEYAEPMKPQFKPLLRQFLAASRQSEELQRFAVDAEKYTCPLCGKPLHAEVGAPEFWCGVCKNFVEGVKA